MTLVTYLNGKYLKEESTISLFDLGFARGFALFEYMKTYGGRPFYLSLHLQRLKNGMREFGISYPIDEKEIAAIISTLMQKNHLDEASIKIFITGGISFGLEPSEPTFAITTYPLVNLPKEVYEKGFSIITQKYTRPFFDVKTTQYANAIIALQKAKKEKAQELLYISEEDKVLELATSHFFGCKNGTIITPKNNILYGVTKDVLLSICRGIIPIEERDIKLFEIKDLDEAFLTASNKEVLPITKIDGRAVGTGKVGPVTKQVMDLFLEHTKEYAKGTTLCV